MANRSKNYRNSVRDTQKNAQRAERIREKSQRWLSRMTAHRVAWVERQKERVRRYRAAFGAPGMLGLTSLQRVWAFVVSLFQSATVRTRSSVVPRRSVLQRRLVLEGMEQRQLLAADITGITLITNTGNPDVPSTFSDTITSDTTPTFEVAYSNAVNGDVIRLYVDGTEVASSPSVAPGSGSVQLTVPSGDSLPEGDSDIRGGTAAEGIDTDPLFVVTIDVTDADADLDAQDGGDNNDFINLAESTSTAIVLENITEPVTYTYEVTSSAGGTPVTGSGSANPGPLPLTISNINVSGLNDGDLTYSVTLTDLAGNVSAPITEVIEKDSSSANIDSVALLGADDSGDTLDDITNVASPRLVITTDKTGGFDGVETVQLYRKIGSNPSQPIAGTLVTPSAGATSVQVEIPSGSFIEGANVYEVFVDVDGAGAGTPVKDPGFTGDNGSGQFVLTRDSTPPIGFTVEALDTGEDGVIVSSGEAQAVAVTLEDVTLESGDLDYIFSIESDGGGSPIVFTGTIASGVGTTSLDLSTDHNPLGIETLPDGVITFSVQITDSAGNQSAAAEDTLIKDTDQGEIASIALDPDSGTEDDDFKTNDPDPELVFTASSPGGFNGSDEISIEKFDDPDWVAVGSSVTPTAGASSASIEIPSGDFDEGDNQFRVLINGVVQASFSPLIVTKDTEAPTGFSVAAIDDNSSGVITETEQETTALQISTINFETGMTYDYEVSSSAGGPTLTGDGAITGSSETISPIDVTSLPDGTLTYLVTLTDDAGNTSTQVSDTAVKYTGAADISLVDLNPSDDSGDSGDFITNVASPRLIIEATSPGGFDGRETILLYKAGGTTPIASVTPDADTTSAELQIPEVDFEDGPNAYEIKVDADGLLIEPSTATDDDVTDTSYTNATSGEFLLEKDSTAPQGTTIVATDGNDGTILAGEVNDTSFTVTGEVGASFTFSVSSDNGGTPITGSGVIPVSGSVTVEFDGVSNPGVGLLADGTLTYSVSLTDNADNQAAAVSDTLEKEATLPSATISLTGAAQTLKRGDTVGIEITFDEEPTGFLFGDDVTVTSSSGDPTNDLAEAGELSDITEVNSTTWTAVWTVGNTNPSSGNEETITVTVSDDWTDGDGNSPGGTVSEDFVQDRKTPTVDSVTLIGGGNNAANALDLANPTATLDVLFSEAVDSFEVSDIDFDSAKFTLGVPIFQSGFTGPGVLYKVSVTAIADVQATSGDISIILPNILDVAGNASTQNTSPSVTVFLDTEAPTKPAFTVEDDNGVLVSGDRTNDTEPTLSGTTEPGGTVVISVDGSSVETLTADPTTGNWSYEPTLSSEGTFVLEVEVSDIAGNTSDTSDPFTVEVDLTPPAVPVITSPGGATSDTTPTISGTLAETTTGAGDNANVTITIGLLGSTTTDSNGDWSITPSSPVADGTYALTAVSVDDVGNESNPSNQVIITIDSTPPNPPVISLATGGSVPAASGGVTNDSTPSLQGTAAVGSQVQLFQDGAPIGQGIANSSGTWNIQVPGPLVEGQTYVFTGTATDAVGNTSTLSADFELTLDVTAPNPPTITSIPDPSNITVIQGTREAGESVTITVVKTGGSVNGTYTGTVLANGATWTRSLTSLKDGSEVDMTMETGANYAISVESTDAAGNTSDPHPDGFDERSFVYDGVAPDSPTINSIPGVSGSDETLSGTESGAESNVSEFSGTIENSTVSNAASSVLVSVTRTTGSGSVTYNGTATLGSDGSAGPGFRTWTISLSSLSGGGTNLGALNSGELPDGDYTILASAKDTAGNTSAPASSSLSVDFTAPVVVINDVAGNNVVDGTESFSIVNVVEGFEASGTTLPAGYTSSGTGSWIQSTDRKSTGDKSARSAQLTNGQTSSLEKTVVTGDGNISFDYLVASSSADKLEFFIDGALQGTWNGTGTATAFGSASFAVTPGEYDLEWRFSKLNTSTTGLRRAFIDNVSQPIEAFSGTVDDPDATLEATLTPEGGSAIGPVPVVLEGTVWRVDLEAFGLTSAAGTSLTQLTSGLDYELSIDATDDVPNSPNNESTETSSVLYDIDGLAVTIDGIADTVSTLPTTISGIFADDDTDSEQVSVTVSDGTDSHTEVLTVTLSAANMPEVWSVNFNEFTGTDPGQGGLSTAAGTEYTITVVVTDIAGNQESATEEFTLDQAAPLVDSVSVSPTGVLNDDDVALSGPASFEVTLAFGEPMNTGVDPTIDFAGDQSSIGAAVGAGSWNVDGTEFTQGFYMSDQGVNAADIDVLVSGAEDAAGNAQVNTQTISDQFDIDTENPVVTGTAVPADGTYYFGDDLDFTVTFDDAVNVVGAPAIQLQVGAQVRDAVYESGTGTNQIVFRYQVQVGDQDPSISLVSSTITKFPSDSIKDTNGNDAVLNLGTVDVSGIEIDAVSGAQLPAGGGDYVILIDGGNIVVRDYPAQATTYLSTSFPAPTITLLGSSSNDTLRVDYSGGNPITGGLVFSGGDGTDSITILDNEIAAETQVVNLETGELIIGGSNLDFTSVESIVIEDVADTVDVILPDVNNVDNDVTLSDTAGAGVNTLSGATIPTVQLNLSGSTTGLSVTGGDEDDRFVLDSKDLPDGAAVGFFGGSGTNEFVTTIDANNLEVNGSSGSIIAEVDQNDVATDGLTIDATNISSAEFSGTVQDLTLNLPGGDASITSGSLEVTDTSGSAFPDLSISEPSRDLNIESAGTVEFADSLAVAGDLFVEADSISQTAGANLAVAGSTELISTVGDIELSESGNDFAGPVKVDSAGAANIVDANDIVLSPLVHNTGSDNFSSGDFTALDWSTSGDAPWTVTGGEAQSGAIGDDGTSVLRLEADVYAGDFSFGYATSTEAGDSLSFYVDGELEAGPFDGTSSGNVTYLVAEAGRHVFEWIYTKDGADDAGDDAVTIDNVVLPSAPTSVPAFTAAGNGSVSALAGELTADSLVESVGGNLSLSATGDITLEAAVDANGELSIDSSAGGVDLQDHASAADIVLSAGAPHAMTGLGIAIEQLTATDDLTVTSAGDVSASATVSSGGDANFDATGFDINLTDAANSFENLGVQATNIDVVDPVGFTLLASEIGSGGTLNISSVLVDQSGAISGAGDINIQDGALVLTLANTYTGTTTVPTGSSLTLGQNNTLSDSSTIHLTGGELDVQTFNDRVQQVLLDSGTIVGAGSIISTLGIMAQSGTVSAILDGDNGLTKSTNGTLVIETPAIYEGTTIVHDGTVSLLAVNALPETTDVSLSAGTLLQLNGNDTTVGSIGGAGNISLGAGDLTIGDSSVGTTGSSDTLSGVISGSGGLALVGPESGLNELTLDGDSTYTGPTSVGNDVVLTVDGSIDSPVTVAADGTLAGGGAIEGNVVIDGTLDPTGDLEIDGNLSLASTSNTKIDSPTDSISVTGTVNIVSGASLELSSTVGGGSLVPGDVVPLITADTITGAPFGNAPEKTAVVGAEASFWVRYTDSATADDTVELVVNAAPTLTSTASGPASFTEGDTSGVVIDSTLQIADPDEELGFHSLWSATIEVDGATADDILEYVAPLAANGNVVRDNGNSTDSVLILVANDDATTFAEFEAALAAVTYRSESQNPPASRTINITFNDGGSDSNVIQRTVDITPVNSAPVADFTFSGAAEGSTLLLDGSSTSDPDNTLNELLFVWNIVGVSGSTKVGQNQSYTWAELEALGINNNGPIQVQLTVSDGDASGSITKTINIQNTLPVIDSTGGPYVIAEGDDLTLSASASDVSSADDANLLYVWELDGDNDFADAQGSSATVPWSQLVSFGLDSIGTYTIALRVFDGTGTAQASTTVEIVSADSTPPEVDAITVGDFGNSRSRVLNLTVDFSEPIVVSDASAFDVRLRGGASVDIDNVQVAVDGLSAVVTFAPGTSLVDATGSLIDGNYELVVDPTKIVDQAGNQLSGGNSGVFAGGDGGSFVFGDQEEDDFYRLYGDVSGLIAGDDQPNGAVDFTDADTLFAILFAETGDANFDGSLDFDGNGAIDFDDADALFARLFDERGFN